MAAFGQTTKGFFQQGGKEDQVFLVVMGTTLLSPTFFMQFHSLRIHGCLLFPCLSI